MKMNLVGAGYWGSKLLESLKQFDVDATVIDIRNSQTIDDINNSDPVILATPLWQHHEQTVELIKRGHDVYVEKPMAETAEQIEDIASHLKDDQLIMVGHIFLHHPQIHLIKSMLDNGDIGDLTYIRSERSNWGIYQTKTDPVLSLATHDISIVNYFQGPMTVTNAQSWNYSNNVVPDRVWFSGTPGYDIDVSWYSPVRIRRTVLLGTKGQIVWDQDANTVTVSKHSIEDRRSITDASPKVYEYDHEYSPLEYELKHWVDCVVNRTTPSTGIRNALEVANVIDSLKGIRT
jgi:predicted dehydrogenase